MTNFRHVALILSGGNGTRMNSKTPKQYMQVDGETILHHTAMVFQQHPFIHEIYVVCGSKWKEFAEKDLREGGVSKLKHIVEGGKTSYESLRNGVEYILQEKNAEQTLIMVHDAVRPLVNHAIISDSIHTCLTKGNAITVIPSLEAFMVSEDGVSSYDTLPRETLYRAQTPHTFKLSSLVEIFERADRQGVTSSQSLFTLASELQMRPLFLAKGDIMNFKITDPRDIQLYQALKNFGK